MTLIRASLLCLLAGALTPLSLAPFDLWPLALFTVAGFALLLHRQANENHPTGKIFLLGWLFGIGLFGTGASWVYVSIHDYGYAPIPLAAFLTLLFVAGLGFVFALPFYIYGKFFVRTRGGLLLAFPALWVLGEWLRSWLLTGFPWLYLGYGHLRSPLAGWFPVTGVWGVSLLVMFSAAALANFFLTRKKFPLIIVIVLFACGFLLQKIQWTQVDKKSPITVGIVQPNFSIEDKWNPAQQEFIHGTLASLTEPLWNQRIILWPEAAISELAQEALPFLEPLEARGQRVSTTLITGIPFMDAAASTAGHPVYYNSIIALGNGKGIYHKVRLVPFGEYVPLEKLLRGLIRFFDLPASSFSKGPAHQELLQAGQYHLAPFVCYEIVFPDLVASNASNADLLVTISNDSWFGASFGPLQHLEMAQARSLETGRYLLRGTNNGISAIINPKGVIQLGTDQFEQETLTGVVYPATGKTPFMKTGSLPLMLLLGLTLILLYRSEKQIKTSTPAI